MIEAFSIGIVSVLLSYFARFRSSKYSFEVAFILLTLFLSFRFQWGNDYNNYLLGFYTRNSESFDIFENPEIGWSIINIICYPLGFFGFVILLTCFESFLIYSTIKKYIDKRWYWLAVFIYVFTSTFMVTGCSMMRQFLVMVIFLYSIRYIFENKILHLIGLLSLCISIHLSSAILFPFVYLALFLSKCRGYKFYFQLFGFIVIAFVFIKIFFTRYVDLLLLFGDGKYEEYLGGKSEGISTGLVLIFNFLMTFIFAFKIRNMERSFRFLITLYSMHIIFFSIYDVIPLTARLVYYFTFISVIAFPYILFKVKINLFILVILIIYLSITLYSFYMFFYSSIWHDSMYEYKSIFSSSQWV